MRVLLGTTEVAGYYRGLKSGFEALGIPCTQIDFGGDRFQFGAANSAPFVRSIQRLRKRGRFSRFLAMLLRLPLFFWAAAKHDVFIFGYATSLLPANRDVRWLRFLGRKVIFQFHGSDSRPPYLDGTVVAEPRQCQDLARLRKKEVSRIDRIADVVVDIPPQGHFHERPFVLWLRLGIPLRPARVPPAVDFRSNVPLRVLHAPSDPAAKGTLEIRAIVERVRARGHALELVEITGRPNSEVLEALEQCDFVIDQLYADYGMPGFATEAAWFGKPVIIGGYAGDLWQSLLPAELLPPTHYCTPEEVEKAVERMATDAAWRRELGSRARTFVETHWSAGKVAQAYLDLLSRPIPTEWLYDPALNRYWQGACQPAGRTRARIRDYLAANGPSSLFLDDKPAVRDAVIASGTP